MAPREEPHGAGPDAGDVYRHLRSQQKPTAGHAAVPKFVPKCIPATWPHAHVYAGPGPHDQGIEVASQSLQRTVTPEAHTYFQRIVQVTQSELEKLLVYKIQQLFDPVPAPISAEAMLEGLGTKMSTRMQLPGASMYAHLADVEGSLPFARPGQPRKCLQEKAVQEGRDLTRYLVGVLGRILADFGRFADTVLRWEQHDAGPDSALRGVQGDVGNYTAKAGIGAEDLVERLERQDRQNTALEAKYNSVSAELRDNRRAFMRERLVWREQLFRLKQMLKRSKCKDKDILAFLELDVQFFDGTEHTNEPTIEDIREEYELRIQQLTEEYEDRIHALESELAMLRAKLQEMQELNRRRSTQGSGSQASVSSMLADMEDLKDAVSSLTDERDCLKERVEELEAEQQKIMEQNDALRLEVARLRMLLEDKDKVKVEVKTEQIIVTKEVEVPVAAPEKERVDIVERVERVDRHTQTQAQAQAQAARHQDQAPSKSWSGSLSYEAPRNLVVSILPEPPSEVDNGDLRAELEALRRKVAELKAARAEDLERYQEAMRRLAEAEGEAEEANRRAQRLVDQLQDMSRKLAEARTEPVPSPPQSPTHSRGMVTDPWTPSPPAPTSPKPRDITENTENKEAHLLQSLQEQNTQLREENALLRKRLEEQAAMIKEASEAEARIYNLKAELAEARRQLEILTKPADEIPLKQGKPLRGGGFNWDGIRKTIKVGAALRFGQTSSSPEKTSVRSATSASPSPERRKTTIQERRTTSSPDAESPDVSPDISRSSRSGPRAARKTISSLERGIEPQELLSSPRRAPRSPRSALSPSSDKRKSDRTLRLAEPSELQSDGTELSEVPVLAEPSESSEPSEPPEPTAEGPGCTRRTSEGYSRHRPQGYALSFKGDTTATATATAGGAASSTSAAEVTGVNMVNMPSGCCSSSSSRPASAGLLAPDVRSAYGGGFSVLHMELLQKADTENVNQVPNEARTTSSAREDIRSSMEGSNVTSNAEQKRRRPRTADRGRGISPGAAAFLGRRPSDSCQLRQTRSHPHLGDDLQSAGVEGGGSTASAMPARAAPSQAQLDHGERRDPNARLAISSSGAGVGTGVGGNAGTSGRGLPRTMSAPGGALPRGRPRSALGRVPGPWVNRPPPAASGHTSAVQASSGQLLPEVRRPPRPAAGVPRY